MLRQRVKDIFKRERGAENKNFLLLHRLIPVFISGLILYHYTRRVDWVALVEAVKQANLFLFIPARMIPLLIYLLIDAYLLKLLLDWFHKRIDFKEVVYARAALYLLALVNIQLSNGGMFLYIMRKAGISAEKLLGLVIFRFAWSVWSINLGLTIVLFAVFILKYNFHSPLGLELIILGVSVIWLSLFICLGLVYYYRHYKKDAHHRPIWNIFIQATPSHYFKIGGLTVLLALNGVINNYLCAYSFGLKIPVQELVIQLPIAELISALPIAFAGLGITTFAWQTLFNAYGTSEAFLSFTIALPIVTYLSRALFGLIALPYATRDIQRLFSKRK